MTQGFTDETDPEAIDSVAVPPKSRLFGCLAPV